MATLSGILSTAMTGLEAAQSELSVTSNNLSNIDTSGYTREVVDLKESTPLKAGNLSIGQGVSVSQVRSVRDNVLELQISNETQQEKQTAGYLSPMKQAQSLLNDTGGTGLQSSISNFFESFTSLSTDTTSSTLRGDVISSAKTLAGAFNETSTSLNSIQTSLDQTVGSDVTQINSLTSQIAQLNQEIDNQGGNQSGSSANTLTDQRTNAVKSLAALVGVNVSSSSNSNDITVTTTNGSVLVSGHDSYDLTTSTNSTTGRTDVLSQGTNITSKLSGGDLAGNIQARAGVASVLSQLDTLAASIADAVNTQQAQGNDANGDTGTDLFTVPSTTGGTAGAIKVNLTDGSKIAAASSTGGSGDNTNALAMAALGDDTSLTDLNDQTPINYYAGIVSTLGSEVSDATTQNTAQSSALDQLNQQLSSVSGVSLDEEAANLIQFQEAYSASAHVISVMNSIYDTAVHLGSNS